MLLTSVENVRDRTDVRDLFLESLGNCLHWLGEVNPRGDLHARVLWDVSLLQGKRTVRRASDARECRGGRIRPRLVQKRPAGDTGGSDNKCVCHRQLSLP